MDSQRADCRHVHFPIETTSSEHVRLPQLEKRLKREKRVVEKSYMYTAKGGSDRSERRQDARAKQKKED